MKIQKMQVTFFKELYKSVGHTLNLEYLQGLEILQVTEEHKYVLEGPIQKEEIHLAIKQKNDSKAPGNDDIPVEFYKIYWHQIEDLMVDLYHKIVQDAKLNPTAKVVFLSLIDKTGRDPLDPGNW